MLMASFIAPTAPYAVRKRVGLCTIFALADAWRTQLDVTCFCYIE